MLFMIVERFKDADPLPIYRHLRDRGRGLPDGLRYVDSWVEPSFQRCFQVMECEDVTLLQAWVANWEDLTDFEIMPVVKSAEAAGRVDVSWG